MWGTTLRGCSIAWEVSSKKWVVDVEDEGEDGVDCVIPLLGARSGAGS